MAFTPVPETAQAVVIYEAAGKQLTNNFYFQQGETPVLWTEDELTELGNAMINTWDEVMQSKFTTNVRLVGVRAISLQTEAAPSVLIDAPSAVFGTLVGSPLPLHSAMTITFRTAKRGRAYRGRIYHYGLAQTNTLDSKTWKPEAVTLIQTSYQTWMTAIADEFFAGSVPLTHVQVSRQLDLVPRVTGVATVVTAMAARSPIHTQRRRVEY